MAKKILILILLATLILPTIALADVKDGGCGCTSDACNMVCNFMVQLVMAAQALVIIGWIVVGILFLMAAGDPGKVNTAKTGLFILIAGTVIVILAPGAVKFVMGLFGIN